MTVGSEQPSLGCDLPIGRPGLVVHNELALTGWATSPVGISGVAVQILERVWNAGYGLDTPATARRRPSLPGADRAGYELRIDTSGWRAGRYPVTVAAFDLEGGRSAIDGELDVQPFELASELVSDNASRLRDGKVAMALDRRDGSMGGEADPLEISGWAFAEGGISAVLVTIDGQTQHEAVRPIVRPDLVRDYGPTVAAEAGFASRLDGRRLTGRHVVTVVAVGRDGDALGVEREVTVPKPGDAAPTRAGGGPASERLAGRPAPPQRRDRTSGPYDPERHAGLAFEARHRLRYRLAATLVEPGQTVVDAGCGTGWGAALLAQAGAGRVIGVDARADALALAQARAAGLAAEFLRGTPEAIDLPSASVDLATCLEAADCVSDPRAAAAELRRVLRAGGVAIVAAPRLPSPRSGGAGQIAAAAIEDALRSEFAHVRTLRQDTALGSVLLEEGEATDGARQLAVDVSAPAPDPADDSGDTVAIASDGELPSLPPLASLRPADSVRRLHEAALAWEDRALLGEADAAVSRTEADVARTQQEEAAWALGEAKARLAALAPVADELEAARDALGAARRARAEAESRAESLEGELARAREGVESMTGSLSWRVTAPLRGVKRGWARTRAGSRRVTDGARGIRTR